MSSELREPPAKKRKSRFGPEPTQDTPYSSNSLSVADDLQRRQQQALAVAASLSKQLGLSDSASDPNNTAPPNTNTFLQTASLFSGQTYTPRHSGLGFGKVHEKRVYIPKDDYPNINFIGLILGPKGLNQKRMQTETGCRILVKGKGSSKNGIPDNDPEEPLHVYISADTQEKVDIGVKKINDLLRESTDKYVEGGMEVKEHRHNGYIDVEIPNSQIGVVIGKQGNNIQRIQDTTGATVMISPRNVPNNPLMKMITISGTTNQCELALKEIYKTIDELKAFRAKLKKQQQHHSHGHGGHNHGHGHGHSHGHGHGQSMNHNNPGSLDNNDNHRDYGTASYDPSFAYPDAMYDDDLLPKISSGAVESGFCEIIIPNSVVGLIIGKNASNVKAMKDRTRCDIRVQKDEETLPDADTRLVALRGCVQSIKAARQEIAKVIHMANAQKQGATIASMHQQNYQQMMSYQQMMYQQQMAYQQQMGYHNNPYQQQQYTQQQPPQQQPHPHPQQQYDPNQQHAAYYQQWQQQPAAQQQQQPQQVAPPQQQQQQNPPPPPPPNNDNDIKANDTDNGTTVTDTTANTAVTATAQPQPPPNTETEEAKNNGNVPTAVASGGGPAVAVAGGAPAATSQQQQQYRQMLESYGWTPQQIAAYQQYPQYYQQYYQQYAQQYPQQYAQYQAVMQQQMQAQQQQQIPPPPPPPPEENENNNENDKGDGNNNDNNDNK